MELVCTKDGKKAIRHTTSFNTINVDAVLMASSQVYSFNLSDWTTKEGRPVRFERLPHNIYKVHVE